jgi:DNA processing protein
MALSSVDGVGPKTIRLLISRFGSPKQVFSSPVVEIARLPRLNFNLASEIINARKKLRSFEKLIKRFSETGIQVLCPDSHEYPKLLKSIENFPPILYRKGNFSPDNENLVAVVGTRFPSEEGLTVAREVAKIMAGKGFTIVSGLAIGVDTAAHKGALEACGKTLAVLGSGLKIIYPDENRQLADDICVTGAVFSECHPNEIVSGSKLMQRNRITSGMSLGVILVEPKKGALNTGERALKQNRHVFIYKPEYHIDISPFLREGLIYINGVDELDKVADQLKIEKNADDGEYLI